MLKYFTPSWKPKLISSFVSFVCSQQLNEMASGRGDSGHWGLSMDGRVDGFVLGVTVTDYHYAFIVAAQRHCVGQDARMRRIPR